VGAQLLLRLPAVLVGQSGGHWACGPEATQLKLCRLALMFGTFDSRNLQICWIGSCDSEHLFAMKRGVQVVNGLVTPSSLMKYADCGLGLWLL